MISLTSPNRSFVTAASMFMNSNALPIALMQSLVVSVPDLMWGVDDNKDVMLGRALTYLTMYSTLGMVVRIPSYLFLSIERLTTVFKSFGIVTESNSCLERIPSSYQKELPKNVLLFY